MRVPLSWLRDFTPIDLGPAELTDVFNGLGLVVEGVDYIGAGLDGVVVGHVTNLRPHPNADRVRLADVDLGTGETQQIACGGQNLEAGQRVPVATLGTTLPNGMTIERRKLRGEWSNGMICSEDELGLANVRSGDSISRGIMVLPADTPIGMPFAEAMSITPDVVFDLEIETNRPDAMCIAGIARDLAAKLGLPFGISDPLMKEDDAVISDLASLQIEAPDLCPRFTVRVLQNVTVQPSPEIIQRRLTLAGMRPINNVVDASNYVMLELGMPSHPYDRARVAGSQLGVRRSRAGETLQTLDDMQRPVPEGACAIVDGNDEIIGLAGVMGGKSSDINAGTSEVLIEVASFDPYSINLTSRTLSLRTDASARFERRVDRDGHLRAQNRIVEILRMSDPNFICAQGTLDVESVAPWPADHEQLELRTARVNAILGIDIDDEVVRNCLEPLGFLTQVKNTGVIDVTVPSYRPDCAREIDLIEEVGRIYGLDNIERRVPTSSDAARLSPYQEMRRRLRALLAGKGLVETWTNPLIGPNDVIAANQSTTPIAITNPITQDESLLRTSMLPGMLRAVAFNIARQNRELPFFEIGRVFHRPTSPAERMHAELAPYNFTEVGDVELQGQHAASQPCDEFERLAICCTSQDISAMHAASLWRDITGALGVGELELIPAKADGLHPTRTAAIQEPDGTVLGYVGEVDPTVCQNFVIDQRVAWIEVDARYLCEKVKRTPQMQRITKYPSAEFDLAFVVPNSLRASEIESTLREVLGTSLEELTLFDVYRDEKIGDESRSLAYRAKVSSLDGTLREDETTELRAKAIAAIDARYGVKLR